MPIPPARPESGKRLEVGEQADRPRDSVAKEASWWRESGGVPYERVTLTSTSVYVRDTGVEQYRSTPGNHGAWILRRPIGDLTEILAFSLWSMDAVRGFAGDDPSRAVYYPKDDRFLVERSATVDHYDVD